MNRRVSLRKLVDVSGDVEVTLPLAMRHTGADAGTRHRGHEKNLPWKSRVEFRTPRSPRKRPAGLDCSKKASYEKTQCRE